MKSGSDTVEPLRIKLMKKTHQSKCGNMASSEGQHVLLASAWLAP